MKQSLRLTLLLVAMMLTGFSARAGSITEEQAKAKAQIFLQSRHSLPAGKRLAPARTQKELRSTPKDKKALYVFNVGEQDGFVIVAGDDRARSILGYVDSGTFDASRIPAALNEMLDIYARQIEMLGQSKVKTDSISQSAARVQRRTSGVMADVTPLLTTTWDQGDPYNAYCPTLNDQTALTGCVATAMAQIAYYHKYPTSQVPSLAAYTSATNKINVSAWGATTFDWDNMLDSYSGSYTNEQKKAVATLMRYCGQPALMDYGFTSGAYNGDAFNAFTQKLGYNANATFKSAASYSANGWEDLIYKEVRDGRPVYYSALNGDDGGPQCGGHAFVIDGYKSDGNYFHVNWGWGGACDGYFNLFALDHNAPESAATATGWHYQMLALIGLSPKAVEYTTNLMKDVNDNWLITSADDWNELSTNLGAYNGGSFKLTADISVTTMVGTDWQPFSGTFDGQGHTLTVNIESDNYHTAPFRLVNGGSTIKNLIVTGSVSSSYYHSSGLIGGFTNQNDNTSIVITNCEVAVQVNGNEYAGGFIGHSWVMQPIFTDCVFSGSINGCHDHGCFVGWKEWESNPVYVNCLSIPTSFNEGYSCDFSHPGGGGSADQTTLTNCYSYYANGFGLAQGTSVSSDKLTSGFVAHALQNGTREWTTGQVWGQQLGTDATPVQTSDLNKGVYKVSFSVNGQVVKTIFANSPIGDKMPAGEDFGLANATFTCNGSAFTSTTPITSDITVTMTGTSAFTLTLGTPANGSISINNNTCLPGILKKVTAIPANGYVVSAVTVTDANGKALPVTQVSNAANEFVFAFPKSSVTINAEFTPGETEPIRFINGGLTLPSSWRSSNQPWTADTWMIWGDEYDGTDNVIVGTPPTDALGHQWYEEGYALTNSDTDILPNGNKIVWENHAASFKDDGNYDYFRESGSPGGDRNGDFYIRRIFTFNTETVPTKLYLSCSYDDAPVEYYINGTLVYEDQKAQSWHDDCYEVELTPSQIALIHTDGTPNVLAVHTSQNWGGYHLDCGLYDPTAISYEITNEQTLKVQANLFVGDVIIPETITYNGVTYTVTEIPDEVTNDCPYMTSMSLPQTVTSIGTRVFFNCDNLQYVKSYIPIYQEDQEKVLIAVPINATEFEVDADCSRIRKNAFKFTEQLTTLTLPRSLTYIGNSAFVSCTALTEIYAYSRPVSQTEGNAFDGLDKSKITLHVYASALDSYKQSWGEEFNYVTMPDPQTVTLTINVTDRGTLRTLIEAAVAEKGSTIYDVTGITVTGNINQDDLWMLSQMCTGVYSLASINLAGASIEGDYIGDQMFYDKAKLTSITLPETLKYINNDAFRNCHGLTAIDIPASVKHIGSSAFAYCSNLATVTGMEGLSECDPYDDWTPFYSTAITQPVYGGSVFLYMPPTMTGEYEMPAGIKITAPGSIRFSRLSAITLPASLTDLGDDTFQDCPNLTDIYCYATTPPNCYSGVWEWGFDRSACTVHVPASAVEDYQGENGGEWREMGRIVGIVTGDLVDLTINVGTAGTLNETLFNTAVANANISEKVLIRNLAVKGNLNADDIVYLNTLPNTLYNMVMLDLSGATLEGNAITERMFAGTLYKSIKLPTAITTIANEAFRDSRGLREVTLPTALKTIGEYAFAGTALASVTLPETVTFLGSHAFAGTALTSIIIPNGVTEMGDRVLDGCPALTSITLGDGITYIPEGWAAVCENLQELTIGKNVSEIHWMAFWRAKLKNVYCYGKIPPSLNNEVFNEGIAADAVLHVYSNCVNRYKNAGGWNEFPTILGDLGTYTTYDLTVNVSEMGGFSDALAAAMTTEGCEEMIDISKLTVTGSMNMDDLNYLRDNVGATLNALDLGAASMQDNTFGDYALSNCGFEELTLPANLEYLGGWCALEGCSNLKSLVVPSSVKQIGVGTLGGASALETVTIGKKVTYFGWRAFCVTRIKDFYCHAKTSPSWDSEIFADGDYPEVIHVYSNCVERYKNANGWKNCPTIVGDLGTYPSYELAVNVTEMGTFSNALSTAMAGAGCTDMTEIGKLTVTGNINHDDLYYLRDNVGRSLDVLDLGEVTIDGNFFGDYALANCGFEELTLPANLESLGGQEALANCPNIKTLNIPNTVRIIGNVMLNGATSLETVTGGEGVTEANGGGFFNNCPNLKSPIIMGNIFFRLPQNYEGAYEVSEYVTHIAGDAFNGCSNLIGITLPTSLKTIGGYAFVNSGLTSITLPETLESIGSLAFAYTGLTSITIPESVTWMGDRCFQYCGSLKKITMGSKLAEIPECLTEFCDKLEEVTIGKRVSRINWRAFRGTNIKHVHCYAKNPPVWNNTDSFYDGINPQGVLHVHSNCVESYQKAEGWKDFRNIVGDLGEYITYDIAVNVPYYGGLSEALATAMADTGCTDVIDISKLTVTGRINHDDLNYIRYEMGGSLDALDLSAVTVEGNVLGDGALAYCRFSEILLPNNIEVLQGWHVLQGCENLKTINIPSRVRYIGPYTLYGATALETVTGGENVNSIDSGSGFYFNNCPNLQSPVILGNIMFRLPEETEGSYEMPENVTIIAPDAMRDIPELTTLTLSENITEIWSGAVANDAKLKDIYFYAVEIPSTRDDSFHSFDRSGCTLHVYAEMAEVFRNNEIWSEFNIVGDLGPMPIIIPMNEDDFAALCNIYNTLGGNSWKNKWLTNKNSRSVSRWRSVTFDENGYVTSIDLSGNRLSGDVGELTFTGFTRLTSMNLSSNTLTGDVTVLKNLLPTRCVLNVELQELGDLGEHTLYEICQLSEGLPSIALYSSRSGLVSTLMGIGGECHFYCIDTDDNSYWDSGIRADGSTWNNGVFRWPSSSTVECTYPHHFTFTYNYEMGDANMDDALNVLDLQSTLNYSNGQEWGLFNFYAADTYGTDKDINVQDIVSTVNILLAHEESESRRSYFKGARSEGNNLQSEHEAYVSVRNGQVVLYTTKPVAALDLRIAGIMPDKLHWNTEMMGFATATTAQNDGTHAIIYSMQPRQIEEGLTVLATYDTHLSPNITSVILSDSKARPISVSNSLPTGITSIQNSQSTTDNSVYDLQGRKVNGKQKKGMYIENGRKVVIK